MGHPVSAFTDDALGDDDAVGIAHRIDTGDITAIEAVEASIARVEAIEATLGAVAYAAFDRARTTARTIHSGDARAFAGVPSFVKDNNDVAGMPTRHGSAAIDAHPSPRDNPPAAQFMAQGYVVLGKSTMPEFGLTASTEFADGTATHNPWDPDYSAGASSGGSASLVAAGAVPIAQGNDGGGSIRIPAAACGLMGLKTTRGRTRDRQGARQLPVNLSAEGVLTRTVRDTAHHLGALESTWHNRHLRPIGVIQGPSKRRLRVGFARRSPTGVEADPVTQGLFAKWRANRLGTVGAIHRLRAARSDYDGMFTDHDVVLSPTLNHPTPRIGYLDPTQPFEELFDRMIRYVGFTPANNVCGGPAIALPTPLDDRGLPGSIQFSAAWGDEATLLRLAYELEAARPFPTLGNGDAPGISR